MTLKCAVLTVQLHESELFSTVKLSDLFALGDLQRIVALELNWIILELDSE